MLMLALLCGSAGRAATGVPQPSDWGLLSVRSGAPIFHSRLSPTPSRLRPLAQGMLEAQATLTHVNIWAQMPGYFFDGEWTSLSLRLAYGLWRGGEVMLTLPLQGRSGGFLDPLVMGFHRLFRVTQARRERYADNNLSVQSFQSDGWRTYVTKRDAGVGLANPVLGVRQGLGLSSCLGAPQLIFDAALKLPVGSITRHMATPNFAALLGLTLQHAASARFDVALGGGIIYSPGTQLLYGIELTWLQKYLFAGVGLTLSPAWRLVLQYLNQDGIAERALYRPLDNTTHEFALGVQWAPDAARAWLIEVGIIENTIHDANTPDFGLHVGLRFYPFGHRLSVGSPS